jgi:transposase
MRDNDGRKLDHAALEAMRIRAVQQIQAGTRPAELAAVLGLNRSTVFAWAAKYRQGGLEALRARDVPGRPSTLSDEQMNRIHALVVDEDPRTLRFEFALWTRELVRALIRREFAVALSPVSVGRLLHELGLSPRRPLWRAYQNNGDALLGWKTEEYRSLRTEATRAGATIFFGDRSDPPPDHRAGASSPSTRAPVSTISAVTAKSAVRFAAYRGGVSAETFIDFCTRLLHDAPGPVFLIVDGRVLPQSHAVAEFAATTDGRLRVIRLPGYSSESHRRERDRRQITPDHA